MLLQAANGFGAVALTALLSESAFGRVLRNESTPEPHPQLPRSPQFEPKARSVIFLFMDGGPSQVDTFDPKPRLDREDGQPIQTKVHPTQFNDVGHVLKSPWKFRPYGQSGIPVSTLFPYTTLFRSRKSVV